jgi:hypothetical protein
MARPFFLPMKILIAHDGFDFASAILDDLHYAGVPPHAEVAVITLAEPECFQIGKNTDGVVGWPIRYEARFMRLSEMPMSQIATFEKLNLRPEQFPSKIISIINPQYYAFQHLRHAACS